MAYLANCDRYDMWSKTHSSWTSNPFACCNPISEFNYHFVDKKKMSHKNELSKEYIDIYVTNA